MDIQRFKHILRWRRRNLGAQLKRLDGYDLALLAGWMRLQASWPRRWWWVNEFEGARVIGD